MITKARNMGNSKSTGLEPTAGVPNRDVSRLGGPYSLQPAFTLAEMLVAVGMGAALVVAAAGVFSLATQAVGSAQGNTQINNKLRVLFSWLDRDFARIRLDGPLVLQPEEYDYLEQDGSPAPDPARADRVFFVISGDIPSLINPNYHASLAMVSYGQDASVGSVPAPNAFSTWLCRWAGLMLADPPADNDDPGPYQDDLLGWSFADLLYIWYSPVTFPPAGWGHPDLGELDGNPDLISLEEANLRSSRLLDHVLSFRIVQYYMAGATEPDEIEDSEVGTAIPFAPGSPKPLWIEFEITLRDSNNQLKEGYTSTYRVNLPSR